ncbi:universal stress protein [Pararhodobacter sp.]|uniref:universal stress protein n=1 Tax=Pararhodobacter sp. TaxID=2127056 RepID=UPI002AFF254E|nr:universal stress protein [Pararhodobacter sp.]
MYHNILVPVAYEPGFDTKRELATARALQAAGGRITLLHVMDPVPFFAISYMPEGWREELIAAIKADLSAQSADLPGAGVEVVEGDAGRAILDWANAEGADCIVMASHRSDPGLFGSTASWVARHAPCAVHLIR